MTWFTSLVGGYLRWWEENPLGAGFWSLVFGAVVLKVVRLVRGDKRTEAQRASDAGFVRLVRTALLTILFFFVGILVLCLFLWLFAT